VREIKLRWNPDIEGMRVTIQPLIQTNDVLLFA